MKFKEIEQPAGWSTKKARQMLGHLTDSAASDCVRFGALSIARRGLCEPNYKEVHMTTRRVSLLVGLLCLIASTSVAAAPPAPKPLTGVIAGLEVCPQEWTQWCPDGATFFGTFYGKVYEERASGVFKAVIKHSSLSSPPVMVETGSFIVRTTRGDVAGLILPGGTLTTEDGGQTFKVMVTLQVGETLLTFKGVLDHTPLQEEIPQPPTIEGRIY
jgi:hypothetical protein